MTTPATDAQERTNGTPPETPALPEEVHLTELWILRLQNAHSALEQAKLRAELCQVRLEQTMQGCLREAGVSQGPADRWVVDLERGIIGRVMPPAGSEK